MNNPIIPQLEARLGVWTSGLPRALALNALCWEGWCHNPKLACEYAREARQLAYQLLAQGQDAWGVLADSLLNIAHLLIRRGQASSITSEIEDADMMFSYSSDVGGGLRCAWLRALRALALNDEALSLGMLQTLLQAPTITMYPLVLGRSQMLMGTVVARMGDAEAASAYFEAACNTFQSVDHPLLYGQAMAAWTAELLPFDAPPVTIERAQQALPIQRQQMDWYSQAHTLRALIKAYLRQGKVESISDYLEHFVMISYHIEDIFSQHYRLMLQAEVEYYRGNFASANALISTALTMLGRLTNPHEVIELNEIASMVFAAEDNLEWALAHKTVVSNLQHEMLIDSRRRFVRAARAPLLVDVCNRSVEQQQNETSHLKARLEELKHLLDMFNEVSSNLNVNYVASLSLDAAVRLSNADAGFFAVANEDTWCIKSLFGAYEAFNFDISAALKPMLEARRVVLLGDNTHVLEGLPTLPTSKVRILVPLHISDRLVGLLNLETAHPQRFNVNVYELMETMQSFVSIALDNALLYERLAQQNHELTASLERVTRLEALKTDMIRLASHDLKQPLTILKLYLSMIQHANARHLTDAQASYFDAMHNAIHMMDRLITDVLSLERLEQIALNPPDTVFDLLEIVREQVQLFTVQALDRQQTLTFATDLAQAPVRGDELQMREAVSNFISNALKYTPDGGIIQVRLYALQNRLCFEVQDNGIGIPSEDQPHIFEPSYRVNSLQTENISGTGWGLYLVKKIIETHRGTVGFTSELGVGSTFFFYLPLIND